MCTNIKYVARDGYSTCSTCGGIDAYGKSKDRPKDKKKILFTKRIMIDFDGVIHNYDNGWQDGVIYGELIPDAKSTIDTLSKNYQIVIFSTRALNLNGQDTLTPMKKWLDEKGIYYNDITGEKWPAAFYIDDRAIRFNSWLQTYVELSMLESKE